MLTLIGAAGFVGTVALFQVERLAPPMATPTLAEADDRAVGSRLPAPRLTPTLARLALLDGGELGAAVGSQVQRPILCASPCTVLVTVTVTVAVSPRGMAMAVAVPRYRDRRLSLCILMGCLEELSWRWLYAKMIVLLLLLMLMLIDLEDFLSVLIHLSLKSSDPFETLINAVIFASGPHHNSAS